MHYIITNYWIGILPIVYRPPPTNDILTPLPMEYWPPSHGILTTLPMVYRPPTHGISTPLSMLHRPPYPWNIDPPTHDILTSLPISWLEMGGINLPYKGGLVFNKGVQYTMDENWPGGQFTMGFKIPYDTELMQLSYVL